MTFIPRVLSVILLATAYSGPFHATRSVGSQSLVWAPPKFAGPDVLPKPTINKQMIDRLHVGGMEIVLEETKLIAVQARFKTQIGHRGDAGDSLSWLCVRGSDEGGLWVLWLESGEINAGTVGVFEWQRIKPETKFDRRCPLLSQARSEITLPVALKLGSSDAQVLRVLGSPTAHYGDRLIFLHEHDETIRGEPFSSDNEVELVMSKGTVIAIRVGKTTTS